MAVCDWCGIREAFLVARARRPELRRPELSLCNTCWDQKWSKDDYCSEPMPPPAAVMTPRYLLTPQPRRPAGPYSHPPAQ